MEDFILVFGYSIGVSGLPKLTFSKSEVYYPKEIIGRQKELKKPGEGRDYLVLKVDRGIPNDRIVKLSAAEKIADQEKVYVIGHPCGLPMKYADSAFVRNNSNSYWFVANLDTYGGNSGSPVFNRKTDEVEGILVRGATDFEMRNGCQVSVICPNLGCEGEDVTRISLVKPFVTKK